MVRSISPFWICAGVLIAVLLSEAALRLFPRLLPEDVQLRVHWRDSDFDPQEIADRELGFRYPPNRTLLHETRDFRMTLHTDEHGLRNKSPWPAQAQIVVVGDSRAFGHGVSEERMWTRLLETRLQPDTLINISLPGLAPQQYFRYFEKLGAPLTPELVLLCIFPGNDVAEARRFATWQGAGSPGNFAEWRFETPEALQMSREPPAAVLRGRRPPQRAGQCRRRQSRVRAVAA